jgi:hypothetical protein
MAHRDALNRLMIERFNALGYAEPDSCFSLTASELSAEARGQVMRLMDLVGPAGFEAVRDLVTTVWDEATQVAEEHHTYEPPY